MARDFAAERERADELAAERGFESAYYQREYVRDARDWYEERGYEDSTFAERLEFAQMQQYVDTGGSMTDFLEGQSLSDWFFDQYEWADWDDFRDWLEEMYREG